jgi:hypothetical protein
VSVVAFDDLRTGAHVVSQIVPEIPLFNKQNVANVCLNEEFVRSSPCCP